MTTDPQTPTLGRPLTETERTMLRYALDQAQDQMLCVGDEFSEDDHDAIDSLRRLADEAQQQPEACPQCGDTGACNGGPCPLASPAAPQQEPPVHGESVAHLAGLHDDEPAVDARQDGAQRCPAKHGALGRICELPSGHPGMHTGSGANGSAVWDGDAP